MRFLHASSRRPTGPFLLALSVAVALALGGCATQQFVPDQTPGFARRDTAGHPHYVYRPANWTPDQKWPVLVYLHGGGERGRDGVLPTQVGLGPVAWKSAGKLPFVVVFPQCDRGVYWPEPTMRDRILASIDDVVANYAGDPARVYLTGNSMGGFGTWALAAHHPERFAAIAPIAGGVIPPIGRLPVDALFKPGEDPEVAVARAIGKLPVWIFHGDNDWLVNPSNSRRMADKVKAAGGDVRLTIFPGVGHESENPTYATPELFDWFLQHRR